MAFASHFYECIEIIIKSCWSMPLMIWMNSIAQFIRFLVRVNWFDCQRLNDNGILIQRIIFNINRMHSVGMEFSCVRLIHEKWELMAHLPSKCTFSIKFVLLYHELMQWIDWMPRKQLWIANCSGFSEKCFLRPHFKQRLLPTEWKNILSSFLLLFWFIDHMHFFAFSKKSKDIFI